MLFLSGFRYTWRMLPASATSRDFPALLAASSPCGNWFMTAPVRSSSARPRVAVTLGDVAGIGPEVAVRAALSDALRERIDPILVGNADVVRRALQLVDPAADDLVCLSELPSAGRPAVSRSGQVICWNVGSPEVSEVPPGQIDARAGRGAYDALLAATDAALAGQVDAVVTAPLHKEALRLAGICAPGHTEILAERCGVREHAMMLLLPQGEAIANPAGLSVAHVTLHTSIASVPGLLSTPRIRETIRLLDRFLRQLGVERPRLGVCALNPHAGEHGLFGHEESEIIEPAVQAEAGAGLDVRGPFPADTLVRRAVVYSEFDGLVAMYHDQGHIPFKLIGFDRAVNVTLGLPIVRTSPSHGTAFDIAWQGIARADGMQAALLTATRLCQSRAAGR